MSQPTVSRITSTAVPLPIPNIDTDQIIPARFLKSTTRDGFGDNVFRDWRFFEDGTPKPEFVLNSDRYHGTILVAGRNFGSGSSREHAAWALFDYGFRAVISSFFADIFKQNALNNSLLPIVVRDDVLDRIMTQVTEFPETIIDIDLAGERISVETLGIDEPFVINQYKKLCIMHGYDDTSYLLSRKDAIAAFDEKREDTWSITRRK